MVTPHLAVTPENTVTSNTMRKIFGMSLKPMVLSHLQFLVILADTLLATLFIYIVMHDELVKHALACFSH